MPNENQSSIPKMPFAVVVFTLAYLLPAIAMAVWTRNGEFIFYSAVMVILAAIVIVVHRGCDLSQPVLWGLSLWGLSHMVGGLVPIPASWPSNGPVQVVYSWWLIPNYLKYDQVVHVFGFGVTTFVCWQGFAAAVRSILPGHRLQPTFGVLVLCMAASNGFGALNEVIEFTATLLLPKTNVGGYVNTGWDLVCNLIGSVIAACWIRRLNRTPPDHSGN
jgi:hypothetical protein